MRNVIISALAVALVLAAVALWLAVTASYGDAQEVPTPEPTVENTATPSIYDVLPTWQPHHSSDVTFDGVIDVRDLYIVARDFGETGAAGICAHVISEGFTFNLVSC